VDDLVPERGGGSDGCRGEDNRVGLGKIAALAIAAASWVCRGNRAGSGLKPACNWERTVECCKNWRILVIDKEEGVVPRRPPTLPPNWFLRKAGTSASLAPGLRRVSKKLRASSLLLRRKSNAEPWKLFVPERLTALITDPLPPNCAL
jgi:hypothetical protein